MPNIIFCLADDWGWPHAGVYGDQAVKTPNFDRLANEEGCFLIMRMFLVRHVPQVEMHL